ncbi:MAG: Fe-S cluster assembly protein IscX [Azoarcus sp.]|jgi:FeS assembly protein IscX|nr:Fe-S cluster assembly protein IscX [Azoarcus sp.]
MKLKWTDIRQIAEQLAESRPGANPAQANFVDLMNWVKALPNFDDDTARCGERILEAIQQAWIDEVT